MTNQASNSTQQVVGSHFDYTHQAWTVDGRYIRCGHRAESCDCYGTVHAGELADPADLPTAQHSRFTDPAYLKREREVSRVEKSIRKAV